MTLEDKLDQAISLLREVNGFHVGRLSFVKELDKKNKDSYHLVMVKIYNFICEEGEDEDN